MPCRAASPSSASMPIAPSSSEKWLWTWRWVKVGVAIACAHPSDGPRAVLGSRVAATPRGDPPMEDWKLPSAFERCTSCAAELQPGQPVTSVIRLAAAGPGRQDLCASCGQAVGGEAEVFFWRRQRPAGKTRQAIVDYTMLRELFGRLLERPGELYARLSYLVALVLI